jgi:hypothetical protein
VGRRYTLFVAFVERSFVERPIALYMDVGFTDSDCTTVR